MTWIEGEDLYPVWDTRVSCTRANQLRQRGLHMSSGLVGIRGLDVWDDGWLSSLLWQGSYGNLWEDFQTDDWVPRVLVHYCKGFDSKTSESKIQKKTRMLG